MRRLLATLVALALILVAADFGLRFLSEYRVSKQIQESLQLPVRPSVSLGGLPYIPRLLSGDFLPGLLYTGVGVSGSGAEIAFELQRPRFEIKR